MHQTSCWQKLLEYFCKWFLICYGRQNQFRMQTPSNVEKRKTLFILCLGAFPKVKKMVVNDHSRLELDSIGLEYKFQNALWQIMIKADKEHACNKERNHEFCNWHWCCKMLRAFYTDSNFLQTPAQQIRDNKMTWKIFVKGSK